MIYSVTTIKIEEVYLRCNSFSKLYSGDSSGCHAHCAAEVLLSTVMTVECFMMPRVSGLGLTDGDIAVESVIEFVKQQYEKSTLRREIL